MNLVITFSKVDTGCSASFFLQYSNGGDGQPQPEIGISVVGVVLHSV